MPAPRAQRCQFTVETDKEYFDSDEEPLLDTTDGEWHCPHHVLEPEAVDERGEYCPFHAGPGNLPEGLSDDDVAEACYRLILGPDHRSARFRTLPEQLREYVERTLDTWAISPAERTQYIGGRFANVSLDYRLFDGRSNVPIDFRGAEFGDGLSLENADVRHELRLDGAVVTGQVTFAMTTFSKGAEFTGTRFLGDVDFHHATFESWAGFDATVISGEANFRGVVFERGLFGTGMSFESAADFMAARFDAVGNFAGATFEQGGVFSSTEFRANATFREVTFGSPVVLSDNFIDDTDVDDRWDRISVVDRTVPEACVVFRNLTCRGKLDIRGSTVDGDVIVAASDLSGPFIATDLDIQAERICVNMAGTQTVSGRIRTAGGQIEYDLTDAAVGELRIPDGDIADVSFHGATFDGFDFGMYKHELAAHDWLLHDSGDDTLPREVENLYLRAKNGAKSIGEHRAASKFFQQEMGFRRIGHWNDLRSAEHTGRQLVAAFRWLSNWALKTVSGYGEAPTRPVIVSVPIVFSFAVFYAIIGAQIPYPTPTGYLTFSTEAFVSLIIGQPGGAGLVLSSLIALEGFLGAFMIALFVFTLTRSISR
jgi:hypothetical protein